MEKQKKKYINSFPKPLLDDLVAGKWMPIIGAGFSKNAVLPGNKKMPLWSDLGKLIGDELRDYESENPIDALSEYEHEYKRPKLIEKLSELLLVNDARPGNAHKSFCKMQFSLVCTTNFDFLLEKQYELTPRLYVPIIEEDQLSVSINDASVALLKLHGDLNHPARLIATESDYDLFLTRYPLLATFVANLLITRTAVLVGYSLDDPDLRQLWQVVGERLGKLRRNAYVITVNTRPTDVARFERRGINVINLTSNRSTYGEVLSEVFSELYEYWQENAIHPNYVKEEQPRRELSLPLEAKTRLCFFAVPISLSSFYREKVFPIIEEYDLVPITADDVLSPGNTVFSKIDAMIKRSYLFIADLSTQNTFAELQLATKSIDPPRILVIVQKGKNQLPYDLSAIKTIFRPDIFDTDPESFLDQIRMWINDATNKLDQQLSLEPRRLLDSQEYRAAVISSITLLEYSLRKRLDFSNQPTQKSIGLRYILDLAQHQGLLADYEVSTVSNWLKIRNEVTHGNRTISKNLATQIVNGVLEMVFNKSLN